MAIQPPVTILIAALGGEGGGVLAEWLVDAATRAGHPAQSTSIPGVAQRTGATTYYIEVYPQPFAALAGRQPALSLLPVPGCVDLVVASELLEAVRTVQNGMVSPERTLLVASTQRTLTTVEKMPLGDGRFDSSLLLDVARAQSRALVAFDMGAIAREEGTALSAVMFGAIAASGLLPFGREAFEAVIGDSDRGAEASRRGFARAFDAFGARNDAAPTPCVNETPVPAPVAAVDAFPAATRDIVALGHERVVEFQDGAYAMLYLERLARVLAAERRIDPDAALGFALTREAARFLALWMTFDDIVRVAGLKCRASRFARVRREVGAGDADIVRIVDYMKPGMAEFASLLPAKLAQQLVAWDRRRQARGKAPFAMALSLRSDGVAGFLALRLLASLRWLRRRGARFAQEQALIETWLRAIETAARDDWQCAHEIALCGRLIKGYGATNERGKENLAHIVDHLAAGGTFATAAQRAAAIRQTREAALADEGGKALDQALAQHGVAARPVKAHPVVWAKRPKSSDGTTGAPREGNPA